MEYEVFEPFSARIINTILIIQTQMMADRNDPQRSYIITAWLRILKIMKDKFSPYVSAVFPEILKSFLIPYSEKSMGD